ncbi:MAG: phosphotransferase [Acidimicrobiia bacterium]
MRRRDRAELAIDELTAGWDLGRCEEWARTPKGSTNTTFFVTTDRGQFVARVSNPRKTEAGMDQEVALLGHLRARGYPAPVVVPDRHGAAWGRLGGALCLVTERLPGVFAELSDPGQLAGSARALARFHCEARDLPEPAQPEIGSELGLLAEGPALLDRAGEIIATLTDAAGGERFNRPRPVLDAGFAAAAPLVEANGALPRMVTHGSLGISAVLFEGPRLTGVLDYERAATEVRALDLAYTLRALARRPKEEPGAYDLPRVRIFMAAYLEEEPMAAEETARLPEVMRAQRLLKVAGKSANFVNKHAVVPQEEKDAVKLIETLELELPRLRWLEEHEGELLAALDGGQAR